MMRAVRVAAAVLIAALTLAASVTGLWHVASETARMGVLGSVAIVAGFDVTAVLVGLRLVERPGWKSWLGLAGLAALSAAAQIAASDAALGWWRLLHGAPSVVAIWTLHGAVGEFGTPQLKAQTPTVRRETKKNQGARNAARSTSSAVAKSAPAAALPGEVPTGDGSPSLIGRERGHRPSATGAPSGGQSLSAVEVVRLLEETGESATKAAVMRVTGWGSGKALRIMPEVAALMSKSNVRPLRSTDEQGEAHG